MIYQLCIFSGRTDVTLIVTNLPSKIFEKIDNPDIYTTELLQTLEHAVYMIVYWKPDGTWIKNVTLDEFKELYNGNG